MTDPNDTTDDTADVPVPTASELHPRLAQRAMSSGSTSTGNSIGLSTAALQAQITMLEQMYSDVAASGSTGASVDSGTVAYRHYQTTPSNIWTISHNLSFRPNVSVVDSGGTQAIPGSVVYLDDSTVQLTFSASFGGEAYLS